MTVLPDDMIGVLAGAQDVLLLDEGYVSRERVQAGPETVFLDPEMPPWLLAEICLGSALAGRKVVLLLERADRVQAALGAVRARFELVPGFSDLEQPVLVSMGPDAIPPAFLGATVAAPSSASTAVAMLAESLQCAGTVLVHLHPELPISLPPDQRAGSVNFGTATIARAGKHLSIGCWSIAVNRALVAADILVGEGIDAEVVDLGTVRPLDLATVTASVERTGRLLIAGAASLVDGTTALVAADAQQSVFDLLDAPVERIFGETGAQDAWVTAGDIVEAARRLLSD